MAYIPYLVILVIAAGIVLSAVRVLREYERGVVFTLGRFTSVKGPGLIVLVPFVQQLVRVDLRTIVLDVPSQDVISHDNVSVKVNAVLYFRVVDPDKAIIQVENFMEATSQLAQTTLRSVLGKHDLDEMLSERDKLNVDLQEILDSQTDAWGIKVANVEIKHVDIDESMVRAIARQAEAERNRRARIINAEGEQQAAQRLVQAAAELGSRPEAMQLRLLSTLYDIAGDKSSTIVFPVPIDLLRGMMAPGALPVATAGHGAGGTEASGLGYGSGSAAGSGGDADLRSGARPGAGSAPGSGSSAGSGASASVGMSAGPGPVPGAGPGVRAGTGLAGQGKPAPGRKRLAPSGQGAGKDPGDGPPLEPSLG